MKDLFFFFFPYSFGRTEDPNDYDINVRNVITDEKKKKKRKGSNIINKQSTALGITRPYKYLMRQVLTKQQREKDQ